ncbi:MAG: fused MFS/spermidine synthase [Acetobacteraceae bacterium]|nr:fused MFS/spermidine synthase [Acetobacteraceae bacterium]MDW8398666.1 fused MFS/spermidine synthase [Acetobacteraceae bacterium]
MLPRLSVAFFASGFAALLCQIVWQRMLGIFAGSDTVSAALVVGAFLAGLGLGSLIGAKVADRLSAARAVIGFALCEFGVAGFALLSKPFLYDFLATGLSGTVDAPGAIFALCFAGLVLPTTLMGASLPLLARAIASGLDSVAERIGTLYGLNTLGAGLGALLGGWVIVGHVGFLGALWIAAALDAFAALLALSLVPMLRPLPRPAAPAAAAADPAPYGGLPLWCVLVFLSGYVIVALEIVWVRLMGQIGQFHAYLFPTVLGIFLLADGAGMAVAARMVRNMRDPRPAFFITQAGGFVLAALLLFGVWWLLPHLSEVVTVDRYRLHGEPLLMVMLLTLAVVGPPAFVIGMTFPFVQRAVQQDLSSVGARVGWVQLANIAGNAAGSLGTGLVTFHLLGTAGTVALLALASFLLLLFWMARGGLRAPEALLAIACLGALLLFPGNAAFWSRLHLQGPAHGAAWAEDRSGVAFFRDETPGIEPSGPFFIQGFSQGRIPFLPVHQFLGAVGPLIHPAPRDILLIGVGSGGTPYAATVSPQTERIRAVELVQPVIDAIREIGARYPDSAIGAMLRDPRLSLEYADGRRLLARDPTRYDIIQADAVLPEASHSGLLYSAEFLEQVRARLAPGGLYVQWAASARSAETFAAVFPYALLLLPGQALIGSNDPIPFDPERLAARFRDPAVLAHLLRGNRDFADFPAMFAGRVLAWTPETPRVPAPLTDVFPRDEFYLNNGVPGLETLAAPAGR